MLPAACVVGSADGSRAVAANPNKLLPSGSLCVCPCPRTSVRTPSASVSEFSPIISRLLPDLTLFQGKCNEEICFLTPAALLIVLVRHWVYVIQFLVSCGMGQGADVQHLHPILCPLSPGQGEHPAPSLRSGDF